LPDTVVDKNYSGIVTLSVINLRKEPHHSSELISQAILGTPVVVLKRMNSWLQIQTPDSYISWTEESSVSCFGRAEMNRWKNSERVIYLENTGWLSNGTSDSEGVLGDVVGGSIMEKTGETKDRVAIVLPDGRKGFVEKNKVMDFKTWESSMQCTDESICKTALTYMGIPYLWGGSSVKGADCSGFVQSVFFRNGYILQRDASLQALHGSSVDISDDYSHLKRGDLLFFGSDDNGIPHVTHVAIYLGNKDYINASGRVMINSFDKSKDNYVSYRLSSLLSARRVINAGGDNGIVPVSKNAWY
jgi:gamma-D-glutamyl-L-lysine dipeptidyl-peptidase